MKYCMYYLGVISKIQTLQTVYVIDRGLYETQLLARVHFKFNLASHQSAIHNVNPYANSIFLVWYMLPDKTFRLKVTPHVYSTSNNMFFLKYCI